MKLIDKVAEFTYSKDVLAMDDSIAWLKKRLELKPDDTDMQIAIDVLVKCRVEAQKANATKPWNWD